MIETFGAFVSSKRQEQNVSLRQFSRLIMISPEYLSKIENNERPAPSADILIRISNKLFLSETEKELLFDLAASSKSSPGIAIDLIEYINRYPIIYKTLRLAKHCNATDKEWQEFANVLAKKNL